VSKSLKRSRPELADFLRHKRESLSPTEVGLPLGRRRRTPGLRREEVAALSGVGLTWYTWLEQGREINVSTTFLENVAQVLKLDDTERRHLFLLAHQRPPIEQTQHACILPAFVRSLIDDLGKRPAHVLNLRWDVVGWNTASDALFNFASTPTHERNMLWMLFTNEALSARISDWEHHAPRIVASFLRDYAESPNNAEMETLVQNLCIASPLFKKLWKRHDVHGSCRGKRSFLIGTNGPISYEHATFILDEDHQYRLVIYAPINA